MPARYLQDLNYCHQHYENLADVRDGSGNLDFV